MPVNTKAFWKVWRKLSLSQRVMKLWRPTKWLGRPMKALDSAKYTAMHERVGDQHQDEEQRGRDERRPRITARGRATPGPGTAEG